MGEFTEATPLRGGVQGRWVQALEERGERLLALQRLTDVHLQLGSPPRALGASQGLCPSPAPLGAARFGPVALSPWMLLLLLLLLQAQGLYNEQQDTRVWGPSVYSHT